VAEKGMWWENGNKVCFGGAQSNKTISKDHRAV